MRGRIKNLTNAKAALVIFFGVLLAYTTILGTVTYIGISHGETSEQLLNLHHDPASLYDTDLFVSLANTMLDYHRFAISSNSELEFNRMPGYPFFLAVIKLITNSYAAVLFIQIVLTALTAALIYLVGVRYVSRGAAALAAIAYTLDPTVLICALTLISDTLFMALLLASVYCVGMRSAKWWLPYAASGACIALAIYVRPPAAVFLIPIIVCVALAHSPWRQVIRGSVIYACLIALLLAPWMIRNYVYGGHFAISSSFAFNVLYFNVPIFESMHSHIPISDIQNRFTNELGTNNLYTLGNFAYEDREVALIRSELSHQWFAYGMYHLAASAKLFADSSIDYARWQLYVYGFTPKPPSSVGSWNMLFAGHWRDAIAHLFSDIPKVFERFYWMVVVVSAAYTFVIALIHRTQARPFFVCAVLIIAASAIIAGPLSDDPRYRLPLEPFLLLLAAPVMLAFWNWIVHLRSRPDLATASR